MSTAAPVTSGYGLTQSRACEVSACGAGSVARSTVEHDRADPPPVTGGGKRASAHTDTQAEAVTRAKQIVGNQGGGEVSVSGRDGKIRAKDTVAPGNDPRHIPG